MLNGTYRLCEPLASDRESELYRAVDIRSDQVVAVQLLRPEFALNGKVVNGFLGKPKALLPLADASLLRVLAIESDDIGVPFVVHEHQPGESLGATLRRTPQGMPLPSAQEILAPVVSALARLHEQGVVHGELDAEHVLLTCSGAATQTRLVLLPGAVAPADRLSSASLAPPPRPPDARADLRSDVWALGALMHQVLSGSNPELAADGSGYVSLRTKKPDLPEGILTCVDQCLQSDPQARPASAVEVGAELDRVRAAPEVPRAEASQAPVAARQTSDKRSSDAGGLDFGLSATVVAVPAPVAQPQPAAAKPDVVQAPAAVAQEVASISDVAAAFASLDEQEQVVAKVAAQPAPDKQKPTPEPKRKKKVQPTAAADKPGDAAPARPRAAFLEASETVASQDRERQVEQAAAKRDKRPTESGPTPAPAPGLSEESLRRLMALRQREEKREQSSGVLDELMFLLFGVLLLLGLPLLCTPHAARAQAVFAGRGRLVAGAFALFTVVVLVRTWALQIRARPRFLRPVTNVLKTITAFVCILAVGFFVPQGALGPVERVASSSLPWASGLFYVLVAAYGLMRGIRLASANILLSVLTMLLYAGGGIFGSYQVVRTAVRPGPKTPAHRFDAKALTDPEHRERVEVGGEAQERADEIANGLNKPGQGAGARKSIGEDEGDDMRSVDDLTRGRKQARSNMGTVKQRVADTKGE